MLQTMGKTREGLAVEDKCMFVNVWVEECQIRCVCVSESVLIGPSITVVSIRVSQ